MIGLGRMGGNIARRLINNGHEVAVYDVNPKSVEELAAAHAQPTTSLQGLVQALTPPRAVWVMLPAGHMTESTIETLSGLLEAGDTIIDGGNTFYKKDDIRRAKALLTKGIHYIDVGTSGGVWGVERGYCMMIGGEKPVVDRLDRIFGTLAPGLGDIERTPGYKGDPRAERGYIHSGPPGAGHFVKMVHNGIEYGLMQAYAEGFDILRGKSSIKLPTDEQFTIDLPDTAEVWRRGSVISSWLLDLTSMALTESPALEEFTGAVDDSGEGRWTINAAIEEAVPADVLTAALFARFRSRIDHSSHRP